ncbi:MAG: caspase family protein [Rhizobiaceae bacterium]
MHRFFARIVAIIIGLLAALACATIPAAARDKPLRGVALIIGNGAYAHLSPLANPTRDAGDVDRLFADLGFETALASDRDAAGLRQALDDFAANAAGADVAVLYYAGHGIEAGGENFLVPVDADLAALDAAAERLVPLSAILDRLKATVPIAIVVLDACRNNPFPPDAVVRLVSGGEPLKVGEAGLGETRGAAPLPPADGQLPEVENVGTVVAFAAEPGRPALDGEPTGNSPYAAAILRHLAAMDGAEFGLVMRMITEEVYLKTKGRQRPWMNESLRRLLYFGRSVAQPGGTEGRAISERRHLLVTIADLDSFGRDQVELVARQAGVGMDAVYAMADVLAAGGPKDPQELEKQLREGADRLKQVEATPLPASADAELDRLTAQAADAMAEGLLETAAAINEEAKARARELSGAGRRSELALVFARSAETYELSFAFDRAAADFAEAAAMADGVDAPLAGQLRLREVKALIGLGTHAGDNAALARAASHAEALVQSLPERRSELLTLRAFALLTLASRSGDHAQLDESVSLYRAAVEAAPREQDAAAWASAMNGYGLALTDLAERDADAARYREAVIAFEAALDATPRKDRPVEWAQTTANLGNALQGLGTAEDGSDSLIGSVAAYRAALEERTRARSPIDWAGLQNNLGAALSLLGAREDGTARLEESLAAHRAALEIFTRERLPYAWAGTMFNLAATQSEIGGKQTGTKALEESAASYRAALELVSRESDPLLWARAKGGLGGVLLAIGARGEGTGELREAARELERALGALDRDRHRVVWARVMGNLGWAQSILGTRLGDKALMHLAVQSIRASIDVAGRANGADRWALMQNVLGTTLLRLTMGSGIDTELTEAIAAFRAALEVRSQARNQRDWAGSRNNLANALQLLAMRRQSVDGLAEAVAAYRDALIEFTQVADPRQWAKIQHNLGVSLRILGEDGKKIDVLKQAVEAFRAALTERSAAADGIDWAMSTGELGRTLYLIGIWDNDTPALSASIPLFRAALQMFDPQASRDGWLDAQFRLADALSLVGETDAAMLRMSADAFATFVETATMDDSAYHWIVAANGRAYVLVAAYRLDGDADRLPEAVDWGRRAVKAATKVNDAENAAYSADTLCDALVELGTLQRDRGMAEEAVQACSWALQVMETMKLEGTIPITQKNLERAQSLLAELD